MTLPDNYPAGEEEALVSPNDFVAIAARRQAILDEWGKTLQRQERAEELSARRSHRASGSVNPLPSPLPSWERGLL